MWQRCWCERKLYTSLLWSEYHPWFNWAVTKGPWLFSSCRGLYGLYYPVRDYNQPMNGSLWTDLKSSTTKFRVGDYTTQLFGDYFVNHHKDPYKPNVGTHKIPANIGTYNNSPMDPMELMKNLKSRGFLQSFPWFSYPFPIRSLSKTLRGSKLLGFSPPSPCTNVWRLTKYL